MRNDFCTFARGAEVQPEEAISSQGNAYIQEFGERGVASQLAGPSRCQGLAANLPGGFWAGRHRGSEVEKEIRGVSIDRRRMERVHVHCQTLPDNDRVC